LRVRWNGVGRFVAGGRTFSPETPEQDVSDALGAVLITRDNFEEIKTPKGRATRGQVTVPKRVKKPAPKKAD